MDAWNPDQYERFAVERSQPFWDLLDLVVPAPDLRVLDLGCGTGQLTRALHDRLHAATTLGVDRSPAMLAKAKAHATAGLGFAQGDIDDFAEHARYDLVFSNAALHWVPDHPALLARLARALDGGGQLAVQVPANHDHPSHTIAAELAQEAPFREALAGWVRRSPVLAPVDYAQILYDLGFAEQNVFLRVYAHTLATSEEVVAWTKGTLLTAYEERLPAPLFGEFVARYRERLLAQLGAGAPYFYAFPRVLFWARRAAPDAHRTSR